MYETNSHHLSKTEIEEEAILVIAAQANPSNFGPLYDKYYRRISNYLFHRLENKDLAFELSARVFYIALNKLNTYKFIGLPFSSWLYRIAANELNQWYRKTKKEAYVQIEEGALEELKININDEFSSDMDECLFAALQALDSEDLDIINLRFFESRPFKEICEIKGITESACKMRVYRVLERLRTELKPISIKKS